MGVHNGNFWLCRLSDWFLNVNFAAFIYSQLRAVAAASLIGNVNSWQKWPLQSEFQQWPFKDLLFWAIVNILMKKFTFELFFIVIFVWDSSEILLLILLLNFIFINYTLFQRLVCTASSLWLSSLSSSARTVLKTVQLTFHQSKELKGKNKKSCCSEIFFAIITVISRIPTL